MTDTETPGRIIGVGGVFFKSADQGRLLAWYADKLGIRGGAKGTAFKWRAHDNPAAEHCTAWSIFPRDSQYFDPSPSPFMINYIVDDLDAFLAKLAAEGVETDPNREDHDYGRFAWIFDADGNKIELWEPPRA
jgi:catechol 2,3-dioxygenase-like lactoylglutathione lyase family enzyme